MKIGEGKIMEPALYYYLASVVSLSCTSLSLFSIFPSFQLWRVLQIYPDNYQDIIQYIDGR